MKNSTGKAFQNILQCHSQQAKHDGHRRQNTKASVIILESGTSVNLPFTKRFNQLEHCTWLHFPKMNIAADDNRLTKFSSVAGLGNKMKLKLRPLPFLVVHIQRQSAFYFQFHTLSPLSKYYYTLPKWLGLYGHSKSYFWNCALCQLPGKYDQSVCQGTQFLFLMQCRKVHVPSCFHR